MKTHPKKISHEVVDTDSVRGKIIRDVALLDFQLSLAISLYFSPNERTLEFHQLIAQQMSFSKKINLFKKSLESSKMKVSQVVDFLQLISKIRNHLAHTHFYHQRQKIFNDNKVVNLLNDWPDNYQREFNLAKNRLRRISNSKLVLKFQSSDYSPLG